MSHQLIAKSVRHNYDEITIRIILNWRQANHLEYLGESQWDYHKGAHLIR